jgi:peptidoglycan hydrolase-like amidase
MRFIRCVVVSIAILLGFLPTDSAVNIAGDYAGNVNGIYASNYFATTASNVNGIYASNSIEDSILTAKKTRNSVVIAIAKYELLHRKKEFKFTTYGYGHGVGMPQNGANFYAEYKGYDYKQILTHYYRGITIATTGESPDADLGGVSKLEAVVRCSYREMGGYFNPEAIKAQAVAVYTYIGYNGGLKDLKMSDAEIPQAYWDAVKSVYGQACFYDGEFALTMFYASSGGSTANCSDIFVADLPYLRSVTSEFDAEHDPYYGLEKVLTISEVKEKIEGKYGIILSSSPQNWFDFTIGAGGYVSSVNIDGQKTIKGETLRSVLGLRSAKFEIELI